jgi:heme/copper-type cytochrome/quinol oxidase subunit 3
VLDAGRLPAFSMGPRSPLFWGAMGVIFIEGTMFALCIAAYFYARLGVDVWPPPGTQFPHLLLPTIETVLLVLSVWPAYVGTKAAEQNDLTKTRSNMIYNAVLAIAAIVLRGYEWSTFNFNWKTDIHGSLVWSMLVLHTFDLGADVLLTLALIAISFTSRYNDSHRKGVDFDSMTWYFLVGIWIPLYLTIYVAPHVVQAP